MERFPSANRIRLYFASYSYTRSTNHQSDIMFGTSVLLLVFSIFTGLYIVAVQSLIPEKPASFPSKMSSSEEPPIRPLPEKLLISYATSCDDAVVEAVRGGINVVIWSFLEISVEENDETPRLEWNSLDSDCIQELIEQLDSAGYDDVIHLVSFGGWNGPHLEESLGAEKWYKIWKTAVGGIFHGIDWDLEGHDNPDSPTNEFSVECLDKMGQISQLAKEDGYVIGMAPPQSYLDLSSSKFSRSVILSEPQRPWHPEFQYFGANVYGYLLAKYEPWIDFVSVQFYESYSRAGLQINHFKESPAQYLEKYVDQLMAGRESWSIQFEDDPAVKLSNQRVKLPLRKLVFGFANGWALSTGDKALFFHPSEIRSACEHLQKRNRTPRGFMFWVLGEEGTNDIFFTKALNSILQVRTPRIEDVTEL